MLKFFSHIPGFAVLTSLWLMTLGLLSTLFLAFIVPTPRNTENNTGNSDYDSTGNPSNIHPIVMFIETHLKFSPKTKLPIVLDPLVEGVSPVYIFLSDLSDAYVTPLYKSMNHYVLNTAIPNLTEFLMSAKKYGEDKHARGFEGLIIDFEKLFETTTTTTTTTTVAMYVSKVEKPIKKGVHPRAVAVRREAQHVWEGYKKSPAWGHDDVRPITGEPSDWMGYANLMTESLGTLFLMGLEQEFYEAVSYLSNQLVPAEFSNGAQTTFEICIRALGGLASGVELMKTLDNSLDKVGSSGVGEKGSDKGSDIEGSSSDKEGDKDHNKDHNDALPLSNAWDPEEKTYGIGGLFETGARLGELKRMDEMVMDEKVDPLKAAVVMKNGQEVKVVDLSEDERRTYHEKLIDETKLENTASQFYENGRCEIGGSSSSKCPPPPSSTNNKTTYYTPKFYLYGGKSTKMKHQASGLMITEYPEKLHLKSSQMLLSELGKDIASKIKTVQGDAPFPPMSIDLQMPGLNLKKPNGGMDPPGTTNLAEAGSIQMEHWAMGRVLEDERVWKGSDAAMNFILKHASSGAIDKMTGLEAGNDGYVGPVTHTIKYLPPSRKSAKKAKDRKPIMLEVASLSPLLVDGLDYDGRVETREEWECPQIHTGTFCSVTARADSYYEYLLKLALFRPSNGNAQNQLFKDTFRQSVKMIEQNLIKWSPNRKSAFLGTLRLDTWAPGELENRKPDKKVGKDGIKNIGGKVVKQGKRVWEYHSRMDHLACFYPGLLLLAYHRWNYTGGNQGDNAVGNPDDKPDPAWLELSNALLNTCVRMYRQEKFNTAQLAPEYILFDAEKDEITLPPTNDMYGRTNILRPETLESLYYKHYFDGEGNCQGESVEEEQERLLREKEEAKEKAATGAIASGTIAGAAIDSIKTNSIETETKASNKTKASNNPKTGTSLPPGAREVKALADENGRIVFSPFDGEDLAEDPLLLHIHGKLQQTTEIVLPAKMLNDIDGDGGDGYGGYGMDEFGGEDGNMKNSSNSYAPMLRGVSEERPGCQSLWQEVGWRIFTAFRRHAKAKYGYSSLDVSTLELANSQESFFMAETLKYSYLLFAPKSTLDLTKWVLSTEAHPYRIEK